MMLLTLCSIGRSKGVGFLGVAEEEEEEEEEEEDGPGDRTTTTLAQLKLQRLPR